MYLLLILVKFYHYIWLIYQALLLLEKSAKDPRVVRTTSVYKKVVSAFSFSWKKKRDLSQAQTELKLPQKKKLITESPTRWGSKLAMIERVLDQ